MPLPPPPRFRIRRLRVGSARADALGTAIALACACLLIAVGLTISVLTWRWAAPVPDTVEGSPPAALVADETPRCARGDRGLTACAVAQRATGPAEQRGGRPGRLIDGTSAEELARRLQEAPQGRWAYALQSSQRQQRAIAPEAAAPRRIVSVVPESALGFAWPLAGVITSAFTDQHPLGIDIAPVESPGLVLAARDGVVLVAGGDPCCGYGYAVLIDHGAGLTSLYSHFREPPLVRAGERLERGTVLGYAGESGHAEGVHLHFEVRLHGLPVDPELVLTAGRLTPLPVRPRATPSPAPTAMPGAAEPSDGEPGDDDVAPPGAPQPPPSPEPPLPSPTPGPAPTLASTSEPTPPLAQSPAPRAAPTPSPSLRPTAPPALSASQPASGAAAASPGPASPVPTASPPGGVADSPRCDRVRLRSPAERTEVGGRTALWEGATQAFITLEVDPDTLRSLVAERCEGQERITVVAVPTGNRRCGATLVDRAGDRARRLFAEPAPDGDAASGETRWLIPLAELWPDPVLRVHCMPVETMTGG